MKQCLTLKFKIEILYSKKNFVTNKTFAIDDNAIVKQYFPCKKSHFSRNLINVDYTVRTWYT